MTKYKIAFAAACAGMFLFGVSLITLGSVSIWLRERMALDIVSSGKLFSILPMGIMVGSFVFGPVADRYGHKIFFVLSMVSLFVGFQGIALSESLSVLQVCIFLFGFGGGAINGATNALVAEVSENKGANLSLLGIFFAVGALGMPAILAALKNYFSYDQVVSSVGYASLLIAILYLFVPFPPPKQNIQPPHVSGLSILKDNAVIFIAFFLFCQTAFEAIVNNWTITFLASFSIAESEALYTLSLYVAGMAITRLILGGALRSASQYWIMITCVLSLAIGCVLLQFSASMPLAIAGMVAMGIGLAPGFPVMLGILGGRHSAVSGTAFSLVISFALLGNMSVNYLMGVVAAQYGIQHLTTFGFALAGLMMIITLILFKTLKKNYAG